MASTEINWPMGHAPLEYVLNNPFGVTRSWVNSIETHWQGMSDIQKHPRFCTFDTPEAGIRAGMKNFQAFQLRHGLHTINSMIARASPPNENNTAAYQRAVVSAVGVGGDAYWVIGSDHDQDVAYADAVIHMELGQQPYPVDTINRALIMAGMA